MNPFNGWGQPISYRVTWVGPDLSGKSGCSHREQGAHRGEAIAACGVIVAAERLLAQVS